MIVRWFQKLNDAMNESGGDGFAPFVLMLLSAAALITAFVLFVVACINYLGWFGAIPIALVVWRFLRMLYRASFPDKEHEHASRP